MNLDISRNQRNVATSWKSDIPGKRFLNRKNISNINYLKCIPACYPDLARILVNITNNPNRPAGLLSMIIVTLRLKVTSSKRAGVISLFESFIGPVSVQPGCLSVNLYSNTTNDDLLLIEEWDSHTNLERHIRSDNFRKILAVIDMADERPEITFRVVSSTEGFGLVEKLREQEPEFHEAPHGESRGQQN